jgi:hypothetical protein
MTPIEHYIIRNTEIEIEDLRVYFNCPKYRGKYFAQMKKEINRYLKNKGLTNAHIASIVGYAQHSMVSLSLNNHVDIEKESLYTIQYNWKDWVRAGVYPKTVQLNLKSDRRFILVEKGEL